ncbi:MAG: hypothetical protein AB7G13_00730 [Lautropia sp.]
MSRFEGTGALALWIDIEPALQAEADVWYVDEHLPERIIKAGYRRAARYVAIEGAPRYLSLFEADTPEALASPGYLALVREISEQSRRLRAGFGNVVRNTFAVRASVGRGDGGVIGAFRLSPAGAAGAAGTALDALLPQLVSAPCIIAAHRLEAAPAVRAAMDAVRATGTGDARVDHVLLVEATQASDLAARRAGPLADAALAAAGWRVDAYGVYQLLCVMRGTDPGGAR